MDKSETMSKFASKNDVDRLKMKTEEMIIQVENKISNDQFI